MFVYYLRELHDSMVKATFKYRVSRGECARLRQNVPYIKVHRYKPKHPYPKLNGHGDNGDRSLKV